MDADPNAKYPQCTAGKRAPVRRRTVAGRGATSDLLAAINDPNHAEHNDRLEWVGGEFDPEKFDLNEVNQRLTA